MASWDVVETDFGDETAHFGPRQEAGTALYQVDTFATISSADKEYGNPQIISAVSGEVGCVAVDKHVHIFKENFLVASLEFDCVIDEIEWSPDSKFVFIGEKSGVLNIVDTETWDILLPLNVVSENEVYGAKSIRKISFNCHSNDTYDVMVLGSNGHLIIITNLNADMFNNNDADTSISSRVNISDFNTILLDTTTAHKKHTFDFTTFEDRIYTIGCGGSIIAVWQKHKKEYQQIDEVESCLQGDPCLIQSKMTSDGTHFFTLDENKNLTLWSNPLMQLEDQWTDLKIRQFILLETEEIKNNSLSGMKLVLLLDNEDGGTTLIIKTLPDGDTFYSLKLNAPTIMSNCEATQEFLYLCEGFAEERIASGITTVRFRCLTETNPTSRLYRYLHKNLFQEAEAFARNYNLDLELVQKVKASFILDQLSYWNKDRGREYENADDMLPQLWTSLDFIKDNLHVAEMCIRAALPTFEDTKRLYQYSKARLAKISQQTSPEIREKKLALTSKILVAQQRFLTFELVYGQHMYTAKKWSEFQTENLLRAVLTLLKLGDSSSAFLVWKRHEGEWCKTITEDVVDMILQELPDDVTDTDYIYWMRDNFIPYVARLIPDALVNVVKWILNKTKNLELLEKDKWPKNGLHLLKSVYKSLLDAAEVTTDYSLSTAQEWLSKTRLQSSEIVEPVQTMIVQLQHLFDLQNKYNCHLQFGEFLDETVETVTFRMLDRVVAVELIIPTLEKQIRPYMKEHNLKEDEIFSKYVKDLLERTNHRTNYLRESTWESKVTAIIGFIQDPHHKCLAVLQVIQLAPIPWSKEVSKLVEDGLTIDHPMVADLKEECRLTEMKKLIFKYGLKKKDVPSRKNAEHLIEYILHKDQPSSLEDAKKVMESYNLNMEVDLYCFYMRHLIQENKIEKYIEILHSASPDITLACGKHVVGLAIDHLDGSGHIWELQKQERRQFTEAAVRTIKILETHISDYIELKDLQETGQVLRNILFLKDEFDKHRSYWNYLKPALREETMQEYLTEFFTLKSKDPSAFLVVSSTRFRKYILHDSCHFVSFRKHAKYSYSRVYRLANILQIPVTELKGRIARHAAKTGDIQTALKFSREMMHDKSEETAHELYYLALELHKLLMKEDVVDINQMRELPDIICQLTSEALAKCNIDLTDDCLALYKSAYLMSNVNKQCESGDFGLAQDENVLKKPCSTAEDYQDWTFDAIFKEDSLIMDSSTVLPLAREYSMSLTDLYGSGITASNPCSPTPNRKDASDAEYEVVKEPKIKPLIQSAIPLMQHLQLNNHYHLALQYTLNSISTAIEYTKKQNVGLPSTPKRIAVYEKENAYLKEAVDVINLSIRKIINELLTKVFNCYNVDYKLALSYILTLEIKHGLDSMLRLLRASSQRYKKLLALSRVGLEVGILYKDNSCRSLCQRFEDYSRWGHKLSKLNIKLGDVNEAISGKKKILPQLAQCEQIHMDFIKDFCRSFNLDVNEGLTLYLESLLFPQKHLEGHVAGRSRVKNRLKLARLAVREISLNHVLSSKLESLIQETCTYDYETLDFLMEEIQRIEDHPSWIEKGRKLLFYLEMMTRISSPSEFEKKFRQQDDKEELQFQWESLPQRSRTRLPFHPLMGEDPWPIIKPELSTETVELWMPIFNLLKLDTDYLFMNTVNNVVTKHIAGLRKGKKDAFDLAEKSKCNWKENDASFRLLNSVRDLIIRIKSMESALASGNWVVKELPMGAEKVLFLKFCVDFALRWSEEAQDMEKAKATGIYTKLKSIYQKLSTEKILFSYGIFDSEYLSIAQRPRELLAKLYEHQSIITELDTSASHHKPDINLIATEVAEVYGLNLAQIHQALVDKWLVPVDHKSEETDLDATMTFNFSNLQMSSKPECDESSKQDDDNLKRILYILRHGPSEKYLKMLYMLAFKNKHCSMTSQIRLRAMRCMIAVADESQIGELFRMKSNIRFTLMQTLSYLGELDLLNVQHSEQSFADCSKEGLVKGLWRNHNHQQAAVRLIASLCIDFKIHDTQLWNNVLQQLLNFGLISNLEKYLIRLNEVPDVWQIPAFTKAWQTVLITPLIKVVPPMNDEQIGECLSCFNLMLRCPVVSDLDFNALQKQFIRIELPICALGCMLISPATQNGNIEALLHGDLGDLLKGLQNLTKTGMDKSIADKIREAIFHHIQQTQSYISVIQGDCKESFILYCLEHKEIDGILQFALKNKMSSEAEKLIFIFCQQNPDIEEQVREIIYEFDGISLTDAYLQLNGYQNLCQSSDSFILDSSKQ